MSVAADLSKELVELRGRLGPMYQAATDAELEVLEAVDDLIRQAIVLVARPSAEAELVASGIPEDWAAMAADHR